MLETVQIYRVLIATQCNQTTNAKKEKTGIPEQKNVKENQRERLTRKNLERKSKNKRDSKRFYNFVDIHSFTSSFPKVTFE